MIYGITYGDQGYQWSRNQAAASLAEFLGRGEYFNEKALELFAPRYPDILYLGARGGGFWLFKAIFLNETLKRMEDGDMVVWMDAGATLIAYPEIPIQLAQKHGIFMSKQNHLNRRWIKRDCFVLMDCDDEKYWNDYQTDASFMIFTKTPFVEDFLKKFLAHCSDARKLTDARSDTAPNLPEFEDHRHDQAIVSLMAAKEGIPRFRPVSQFGEGDAPYLNEYELGMSNYKPYVDHHRIRC
jgi:hypothetical protein